MHISNKDIELKPDSGNVINPQNVDDTMNSSCYTGCFRRNSNILGGGSMDYSK